jgi:hypothetical protein
LRLLTGFGVVIGGSCDQGSDECVEQSLSASPSVVDELEESEIDGQLLRAACPARYRGADGARSAATTRSLRQQRPEAFDGIDVDFAEAVAIRITRILAPPMADRLVPVAPARQAGIDGVLVGVDERARRDGRLDDRLDCCLPDIVEHLQNDVAVALDQAADRWLLRLQGAPAGGSFEPAAPSEAAFLATAAGLPLWPATT